jgi:radical SAM-linked protein
MARQRTPEGPPPAPAVQKLRVRYAKRGRLRFSSTRDFARALERALRRADVPMAFSGGFHPHPLISYANAAPTGTASEAEYFEIRVTERVDPEAVRAALDEALPDGLDVVEVVEAGPGALADRLEGSEWRIVLRGVDAAPVADAVARYLACERAETTRTFKTGPRTFDTRGAVLAMAVSEAGEEGCAILRMVVRHTTPSVRPDDILTALRAVTGFSPPVPPLVTRLAQGPLLDAAAGVADPLAADKDAAGSG